MKLENSTVVGLVDMDFINKIDNSMIFDCFCCFFEQLIERIRPLNIFFTNILQVGTFQ